MTGIERMAVFVVSIMAISSGIRTASAESTRAEGLTAWQRVYSVPTHPRCVNCHTATTYPQQGDDRHVHFFDVARGRAGFGVPTPRGAVPVHNIIGKFNGTADPTQQIFILAGHYDTLFKPGFLGANDGGSSTAILLAFADALAHQTTKMQLWLVWTDLEEAINSLQGDNGLYGSRHLAQKLKAAGVSGIKGLFLLDMIGDKALGVTRESGSTRWLQDFIARAAKQLGYSQYFFQDSVEIIDDHVSSAKLGVPVVDVVDAQFGRMGPGSTRWGSSIMPTRTRWTRSLRRVSTSSAERFS